MRRKSLTRWNLAPFAASFLVSISADADVIVSDESNAFGQSWNTATAWNPDGEPIAGNDYVIQTLIRTPVGGGVFAGDSLTIDSGGTLGLKNGSPVTVANLIGNGGQIAQFSAGVSPDRAEIAGGLTVNAGGLSVSVSSTSRFVNLTADVSGSGALNQTGVGVLELRGDNSTYTGAIAASGTLDLYSSTALGTSAGETTINTNTGLSGANSPQLVLRGINIVGETLNLNSDTGSTNRTKLASNSANPSEWSGPINLNGDGFIQVNANSSGLFTISGDFDGPSFTGQLFFRGGGDGLISGNINMPGAKFAKTDASTWTITSTGNDWDQSVIARGSIVLGANDALDTGAGLVMGEGNNSSTLDLNGYNQTSPLLGINGSVTNPQNQRISNNSAFPSILTVDGSIGSVDSSFGGTIEDDVSLVLASATTLTLGSDNTYTGTTTIPVGGTIQVGDGGTTGLLGTGNVTNDGTLRFNRTDSFTFANLVSGTGDLIHDGTGSTTLSAAHTYTGDTTVNDGTLAVTGSLDSTTDLIINGGAFAIGDGLAATATQTVASLTQSAGSLSLDLGATGNDQLIVTGNYDHIGGSVDVVVSDEKPAATPYSLVSYGGLTGTPAVNVSGLDDSRMTGTPALGSGTADAITITFSDAANLTWEGDLSGDWDFGGGGTNNWDNSGSPDAFMVFDTVTFADGATSQNPLLVGDIKPNAVLFTNATDDYTLSGIGSLVGSTTITKTGAAKVTITNTNNHTGTNTISGGTIEIGDGGTLGSGEVVNNSSLVFNRSDTSTFANLISGSGSVAKTGGGTVVLTNTSTYSGGTSITDGTLQLGDGTLDGGVAGTITNDGVLALAPSSDLDFANLVTGSGSVSLLGAHTFRLTAPNSYGGETLIGTGTLLLDAGSDIPAGSGVGFIDAGGTLDADTKTLTLPGLRSDGIGVGINTVLGSNPLTVAGGDLLVGPTSGSSPNDSITLDLTDLPGFTFDNASGIVSVGCLLNNGTNRSGTLDLPDTASLTAGTIKVQEFISSTSAPSRGTLNLGADTTLNTNEIQVAHSGRDAGTIQFRPDLSAGSLTIRAADGTGRAEIDLGRRGSSFHSLHNVTFDLVSGGAVTSTLDALVDGLFIGDIGFGNNATQNTSFLMGGGTLDAVQIKIGRMGNGGTGGTLNSTFSVDGGDVIAPSVVFGDNTSGSGDLNATFSLVGGSLAATTLQAGTETSGGTSTRVLDWQGGTLANTLGADLSISGIIVDLAASGSQSLVVESGQTATLGAGTITRFGIDSSTSSSATLTVTGDLVLAAGAVLDFVDEASIPQNLPPETKITLIDYSGGSLTGVFEDATATPINTGDSIVIGSNFFTIDYNDASAVTLTADSAETFVYDVGDRVGFNPMSNDAWTGDDLANWIGASFGGDIYARNNNGGNDRITRTNDGGFSYAIPTGATSVSIDMIGRFSGASWQATLTTSGSDTLGIAYDGAADKLGILDGATLINEIGTTTFPDGLYTLRVVVNLVAGTADLILDPDGAATLVIDDTPVLVTATALAAADGLGMRSSSQFSGFARYTIGVTTPAGAVSPYDDWAASFSLDPLGNGAPGEDPDEDGKTNLLEFATNDNPVSGASSGKVVGLVQDVGGDTVLTYTLPVRGSGTPFSGATEQVSAPVDGIIYRIQGSDELTDWTTMVVSEVVPALDAGLPPLDAGWEYRTFRTPDAIDTDPEDFIRAVIDAAP